MVGPTLVEIREHIESLASDDGDFALLCGRTGERPFPVAGKRFDSRASARAAATATAQYRAALRRYDPQLPWHDVIVREESGPLLGRAEGTGRGEANDDGWELTAPAITGTASAGPSGPLVEFCHDVAAAVFETLSVRNVDGVESAVMHDYLSLAETVADPDRLCLCLVESMAGALGEHLAPADQATVLAEASDRLAPAERRTEPVAGTFAWLQRLGLVGEYTRAPVAMDRTARARSVRVELREYALRPRDGRLPTLPVVVELCRRSARWPPAGIRACPVEGGWHLTIRLAAGGKPAALASVPVPRS